MRRRGSDGTTSEDVVGLSVKRVAAGSHEHDVARLQLISEARQGRLDLRGLDLVAVGFMAHVDDDAVGEEPLER